MATGSLFSQASRRFVLLSCFYNRSLFTQSSGDELSHVLHKPVMLKEVLAFLSPRDGQVIEIVLISFHEEIFVFVFTTSLVRRGEVNRDDLVVTFNRMKCLLIFFFLAKIIVKIDEK